MEEMEGHLAVTHWRPQVSDLMCFFLAQTVGTEETHPGISKGLRVKFLRDGNLQLRDAKGSFVVPLLEEEEKMGISFYGVGRGKRDEHAKDIIDCETTLLAKEFRLVREAAEDDKLNDETSFVIRMRDGRSQTFVVSDARYRRLFKAIAENDIKGSPNYWLGNLVTTLHGAYPENPHRVMELAFEMFEASIAVNPIPKEERAQLRPIAAENLFGIVQEIKHDYCRNAYVRISDYIEKRALRNDPLDLIDCITELSKAGKDFRAWTETVVRADLAEQHHFHTITTDEAKKAELHAVRIRVRDGENQQRVEERKIAVIVSDDPHVHKYLMSKNLGYNAAIVIKQNSKGQVQIWPGRYSRVERRGNRTREVDVPLSFLMPFVAATIRDAERELKGLPQANWQELVSDDGPEDDTTWFFYSRPGWLMNGSNTAPDISPTKLPPEEITRLVVKGIDDTYAAARGGRVYELKMH